MADEPQEPLPGIRFACPPRWLLRVCGRSVARLMWVLVAGVRYRPDLYMGYYLLPAGCFALMAAQILGRPAAYQMTGGPVEVEGGGIASGRGLENCLVASLELCWSGWPSPWFVSSTLSWYAAARPGRFFEGRGISGPVKIITGSVTPGPMPDFGDRPIDLVFVGRLVRFKQPEQFIDIVAAVRRRLPAVRATIVGDGPLLDALRQRAAKMGVAEAVEFLGKRHDVESIVARSKVFVLTSISEGLSIAMAEAMVVGVVPVVANVGELGDLVEDGATGFLVEPNSVEQYADRIVALLQDADAWSRMSTAAAKSAASRCGVEVVSAQWQECLGGTVKRASRNANQS